MKINLLGESITADLTPGVEKIEWSGDIDEAARTLKISFINNPLDKTLKIPKIKIGDAISATENKEEIFFGQIMGVPRSNEIGTVEYEARDIIKHLLESNGRYNFKNKTPESITRQVCGDIQVPVGSLASTGVNIKSMICDDDCFYDIIMGAYTQAYKVKKHRYMPVVKKRKLCVVDCEYMAASIRLSDAHNITSASNTETCDEIVNSVKIYDDKGKQIGHIKDASSIKKFGVYQKVYQKEEGVSPSAGARALMKGKPAQEISVDAIGDLSCVAGRKIEVTDASTGLSGEYWIKSDTHTWENGTHMMHLDLSFQKMMATREIEVEKEKKEKKK